MAVSIIPEVGNFVVMGFIVVIICAGLVAASIRFSGLLRDLFQG